MACGRDPKRSSYKVTAETVSSMCEEVAMCISNYLFNKYLYLRTQSTHSLSPHLTPPHSPLPLPPPASHPSLPMSGLPHKPAPFPLSIPMPALPCQSSLCPTSTVTSPPSPQSNPDISLQYYGPGIGEWALWQPEPGSKLCVGKVIHIDHNRGVAMIQPAPAIDEKSKRIFRHPFEKTFRECELAQCQFGDPVPGNMIMKLLWPAFLDTRDLEDLGYSTETLRPEDLAKLHPQKKLLVNHLRSKVSIAALIILSGRNQGYQGQFAALTHDFEDLLKKKKTRDSLQKVALQFHDCFTRYLDDQDSFLIDRITATEVAPAMVSILEEKAGTEMTASQRSWAGDYASGPGIVILACWALSWYLQEPVLNIYPLLQADRIYREPSIQDEAWSALIICAWFVDFNGHVRMRVTHRVSDPTILPPPLRIHPLPPVDTPDMQVSVTQSTTITATTDDVTNLAPMLTLISSTSVEPPHQVTQVHIQNDNKCQPEIMKLALSPDLTPGVNAAQGDRQNQESTNPSNSGTKNQKRKREDIEEVEEVWSRKRLRTRRK
ncbi:hypothetical protein M422DRAFT_249584 [Sphaerobolus stellatus SS14]|uniref:Uncharacterized protein n=1 Tax=Sphaerobolus stellatus (strain SS14) TaxID=990650 RepID=A0A0C9UUU0_SPHS4|nr:hypothetical protein M422DRAFT_249584 [Sphaerobolus stellatus SS14]